MESRYALRELEGAIGYDCRRLEDGRPAVFRHTSLHKRARRDYFELQDVKTAMRCSFVAAAARGARPTIGSEASASMAEEGRIALLKVLFPYNTFDKAPEVKEQSFDELFDELDMISENLKRKQQNDEKAAADSGNGDQVGIIDGKVKGE